VNTPKILFVKVKRYRFIESELPEIQNLKIPEDLELSQYLGKKHGDTGEKAQYRLAASSHAVMPEYG
jgi:hypothetical protein